MNASVSFSNIIDTDNFFLLSATLQESKQMRLYREMEFSVRKIRYLPKVLNDIKRYKGNVSQDFHTRGFFQDRVRISSIIASLKWIIYNIPHAKKKFSFSFPQNSPHSFIGVFIFNSMTLLMMILRISGYISVNNKKKAFIMKWILHPFSRASAN